MRTELARSRIICRSALRELRRISSSAGCESSAERCRSTSSAVLHLTMPAHLPEIHLGEHGAHFEGPDLTLGLASSVPLHRITGGVVTDFTLGEGESVTFVLRRLAAEDALTGCPGVGQAEDLFRSHRRFLAAMAFQVHLFGSLAGDRPAFRIDAQAFVLRANRRYRGGSHLQLAGVDRRTTQLGLSVYLDS